MKYRFMIAIIIISIFSILSCISSQEDRFLTRLDNEDTSRILDMLDEGFPPNTLYKGKTPLMYAAIKGNEKIVKTLIDKGAKIDTKSDSGFTALMYAVQSNHPDIVTALIDMGAYLETISPENETALIIAIEISSLEIIDILLEKGAHINAKDTKGLPIILYAAGEKEEIINRLLEAGADINASNQKQETILMLVIKNSFVGMKFLLENGANPNISNSEGKSPLMMAMHNPYVLNMQAMIETLLDYGADSDFINKDGISPLMYAVHLKKIDVLKLLIAHGTNINKKNNAGETALSLAKKTNDKKSIALLLESGAIE